MVMPTTGGRSSRTRHLNNGRVLDVRVPCLSEQTRRSVLGLTPVYNLLPFSFVDLKTVREFQAGLQDLMKQVAASNNDQWQSIFSPRIPAYQHPLKMFWR